MYNSVKPIKSKKVNKNRAPRKSKNFSKKLKKSDIKLNFKLESVNENNSADGDNISKKKKTRRNSALKMKRGSLFTQNESPNNKNIKNSKTSKNLENKNHLSIDKKSKNKQRRKSYKTNISKSDFEDENNKKEGEDQFEYFAQEKKDGCKIS